MRRARQAMIFLLFFIGLAAAILPRGGFSQADESHFFNGLKRSLETLSPATGMYAYGGLYFAPGWIALGRASVNIVRVVWSEASSRPVGIVTQAYTDVFLDRPAIKDAIASAIERLDNPKFVWRVRAIFAFITLLSVFVAAALAAQFVTGIYPVLAAALVALSWEVNYQARLIAVDGEAMTLVSATILFAILYYRSAEVRRSVFYLLLAATCCGLAFSTKVTGAPSILAIWLAVWLKKDDWVGKLSSTAISGFVALIVLLIVNPGILIDPTTFLNHIMTGRADYNMRWIYYPFQADNAADFFGRAGGWFVLALFSPYRILALAAFLLAVVGAVEMARRHPKELCIIVAPLLAIAFVLFSANMIVVRNYLIFVPALAAFASVGACALYDHIDERFGQWRLATASLALLMFAALNIYWLFHTALNIHPASLDDSLRYVVDQINAHPDKRFLASKRMMLTLSSHPIGRGLHAPVNLLHDQQGATCIMFASEHNPYRWVSNVVGYTDDVYPSFWYNKDYYSTYYEGYTVTFLPRENAARMEFDCLSSTSKGWPP